MKRVMLCIFSFLILGYINYLYNNYKEDNIILKEKIETLNNDINLINKTNIDSKEKLDNLKEKSSKKIKELELWKQMKEKVTNAL